MDKYGRLLFNIDRSPNKRNNTMAIKAKDDTNVIEHE